MPLATFAFALALAAQAAPDESRCSGSTLEMDACVAKVLTAIEAEHLRYADAARRRLQADAGQTPSEAEGIVRAAQGFERAEAAWAAYRDAECGAAYDWYSGGSIRNWENLSCRLRLTRERTHGIWLQWLTYPDSTPSILPEPCVRPQGRQVLQGTRGPPARSGAASPRS